MRGSDRGGRRRPAARGAGPAEAHPEVPDTLLHPPVTVLFQSAGHPVRWLLKFGVLGRGRLGVLGRALAPQRRLLAPAPAPTRTPPTRTAGGHGSDSDGRQRAYIMTRMAAPGGARLGRPGCDSDGARRPARGARDSRGSAPPEP